MPRKRNKNGGSTRMRKSELVRKIISIFKESPEIIFNYKQLSKLLTITSDSQKVFINEILYELSEEDYLTEVSKGKFKLNSRGGFITGTITREGVKTFLAPDDGGELVFIPERKTNHALLNDKVKVFLYARQIGRAHV